MCIRDRNITINDDDSPGLVFTAQVATITEGNTGTFTVRLNSQPSSDVTLTATSSDTGALTVSPSSVTYSSTNWGSRNLHYQQLEFKSDLYYIWRTRRWGFR